MSPEDVQTIGEAVRRGITSALSDVLTCTPCQVVTFDPALEAADLRPLVRRPVPTPDGSIAHEELPILPNVMVCFPQGAGVSVTWSLSPGDVVLAVASAYAIGQWRATGQLSDAGDVRQHHPGSVFCLPLMSAERATPAVVPGTVKLGARDATDPAVLGTKLAGLLEAIMGGSTAGANLVLVPPNDPETLAPWDVASILSTRVLVGA